MGRWRVLLAAATVSIGWARSYETGHVTQDALPENAAVCMPLDPAFVCSEPLRPNLDYSSVTGVAQPGVPACPCEMVRDTVPSMPVTDKATLCALSPLPLPEEACSERPLVGAFASRLVWHMSQIPAAGCSADLHDASGPCGDPTASQTFLPICALIGETSARVGELDRTHAPVVVLPHVAPEDIEAVKARPGVFDECTPGALDELATSGDVACAERPCDIPQPKAMVRSTCSASEDDPCLPALDVVAYSCTEHGGALTYDHDGCTSSVAVNVCIDNLPTAACEPGISSLSIEPACVPSRPCFDARCSDIPAPPLLGEVCTVPGTFPNGTRCNFECPAAESRYRSETGPCSVQECGLKGTASLQYIPCAPGGSDVGCLAHPVAPENSTVECWSAPCPCVDGDECERPNARSSHLTFDRDGVACDTGTLDIAGKCCPSPYRDPCGYCRDAEYPDLGPVRLGLDSTGSCCNGTSEATPVLTASLICCPSVLDMDVCGVCGGTGTSCSVSVGYDTGADASGRAAGDDAARMRTIALRMSNALGIPVRPSPPGSLVAAPGAGASLSRLIDAYYHASDVREDGGAGTGGRHLRGAHTRGSGQLTLKSIGVPGNGYCEIGESPDQEPACSVSSRACPALIPDPVTGEFLGDPSRPCGGNGVCVHAARVCKCFWGFAGTTCGSCAPGFTTSPSQAGRLTCIGFADGLIEASLSSHKWGAVPVAGTLVGSITLVSIVASAFKYRAKLLAVIKSKVTPDQTS